jgi:RimJ/RimL family protein N-acetyltransferase/nucleotide-binding universal stress UspA family protein
VEVEQRRRLELRDGSAVEMRPVSAADRQLLQRGFERLSPESRYRRFFSPVSHLSERQLDYLTDVDHRDHEALVALAEETGEAVAVARYVRTRPGVAEPAIVVADDWQGRGLASQLLDALADRAREEGVECFVAPVLAENRAAIALFERLGDATVRHDGIEVELTIPLGAEEGATPSLRQLLREVAVGSARPALTFWQRITTSSRAPVQTRNAVVVGLPRAEAIERLAEVAGDVAEAFGAGIQVVAAQRFLLDDAADLSERLDAAADRLRSRGLEVGTHLRRGDLAASILAEAVRCSARLIVVDGTEPHARAPLVGSTWDHVSHHAPCAVLVAR